MESFVKEFKKKHSESDDKERLEIVTKLAACELIKFELSLDAVAEYTGLDIEAEKRLATVVRPK